MASKFDESDFVDSDYQAAKKAGYSSPSIPSLAGLNRPPTREEIEQKVSATHQKLAELKREQEDLERERAALEEARRRRIEFQTGKQEMLGHLTRGTGLLTEAEFAARRDAEQMAKSLAGLRDALGKVEVLNDALWTDENWNIELTKALTALENARMEWNSARLKWPILDGPAALAAPGQGEKTNLPAWWEGRSFFELGKLGLALNWPAAAVSLIGVIVVVLLLLRR